MNVVIFQAAWLGAVGGAGAGLFWLGPVAALAVVATHLALAARPARELCAVACVAAIGTTWDTFVAALGLIGYHGGLPALGGTPLWIVALWIAFATTLNASLRWLRPRPAVALVLGAVAGPLCYAAAARFGALELVAPVPALALQAVGWSVLLPATLALAARFDGLASPMTEHARV